MEVEVVMRYGPRFQQPNGRATVGREERLLRLLVGDTSGARSQLSVPYQKRRAPCSHPFPIPCECILGLQISASLQSRFHIAESAMAIAPSLSASVPLGSVFAMRNGLWH